MVWVHVTLATLTWLAVLWAVAAAGRLVPRAVEVSGAGEPTSSGSRELELVGPRWISRRFGAPLRSLQ